MPAARGEHSKQSPSDSRWLPRDSHSATVPHLTQDHALSITSPAFLAEEASGQSLDPQTSCQTQAKYLWLPGLLWFLLPSLEVPTPPSQYRLKQGHQGSGHKPASIPPCQSWLPLIQKTRLAQSSRSNSSRPGSLAKPFPALPIKSPPQEPPSTRPFYYPASDWREEHHFNLTSTMTLCNSTGKR